MIPRGVYTPLAIIACPLHQNRADAMPSTSAAQLGVLKNTPMAPFLLGLQKPFSVALLHPL